MRELAPWRRVLESAAWNFRSKNWSKKRSRIHQGTDRHHRCSSYIFVQDKYKVNTKLNPSAEKGNKNYDIHAQ